MTALNTAIFVQGKQDPWEIYNTALQQILFYAGRNCARNEIEFRIHTEPDGREAIYISPHENMPIQMGVYHRSERMLFTEEEAREKAGSGCGKPDCSAHAAQPAHLVVALASSVYWEDADRSWNAGNLHSGMVWAIGGFLDAKKVPWKWQENISHATHVGYEALNDFAPAVDSVKRGLSGSGGFSQVAQAISREIMKRMGLVSDDE